MSYSMTAFLSTEEPPPAREARENLLEGALFDQRPEITVDDEADGSFNRWSCATIPRVGRWDFDGIAAAIEQSKLVLEWAVERGELDRDAWFALAPVASLGAPLVGRVAARTGGRTVRR